MSDDEPDRTSDESYESNEEYIDRVLESLGARFSNYGNSGTQGTNFGNAVGSAKDCLFAEVHNHFESFGISCENEDGTGCGGRLQKNEVLWEQNTNLDASGLVHILNQFALRAMHPAVIKPERPSLSEPADPSEEKPEPPLPKPATWGAAAAWGAASAVIGSVIAGVLGCILNFIFNFFGGPSDTVVWFVLFGLVGLVTLGVVFLSGSAAPVSGEDEAEYNEKLRKYEKKLATYRTAKSEYDRTLAAYSHLEGMWKEYRSRWPKSWTCKYCGMQYVLG